MKANEVVEKILLGLDEMFPDARCELYYEKDYELLIATVLSAQCTEKSECCHQSIMEYLRFRRPCESQKKRCRRNHSFGGILYQKSKLHHGNCKTFNRRLSWHGSK